MTTAPVPAPVPVPAPAQLAAHEVTASYRRQVVLDRVSLWIDRGETVGLRGPSGGGKSTLVRVLALLHRPDHGRVTVDGTPVTGTRYAVPVAVRTRIAVLFQSPRAAADPRLSLTDLIAEPLRATRHPDDEIRRRVAELADLVGLTPDLLGRRPHAVSDGQLQRACLARALTHRPDYLLCDEATAMLDASTQAHVAAVITDYQQAHRAGVLLVTHDPALMSRWADRVVDLPTAAAGAGGAGRSAGKVGTPAGGAGTSSGIDRPVAGGLPARP
ncbi:ATP-binding cassette domain-containing protein [Micromonosporaceae bacterium B7E4]